MWSISLMTHDDCLHHLNRAPRWQERGSRDPLDSLNDVIRFLMILLEGCSELFILDCCNNRLTTSKCVQAFNFIHTERSYIFDWNSLFCNGARNLVSTRAQSLSSVQLLCNSMDCSPVDSSISGIFQTRMLEWVTISSSWVFMKSIHLHMWKQNSPLRYHDFANAWFLK